MKSGPFSHCVSLQRVALAVLTCLLFAAPAMATTYIAATDEELVHDSSAVVEARILSRDFAPGTGLPATDYFVEVVDVLAGEITGRNLVIRVPGGERPDGVGVFFAGMPSFTVGERALIFLAPNSDGTYGVRHSMQGAFHEVARGGQSLYVRGHQGAEELVLPGLPDRSEYRRLRSAAAFRRWIEEVDRGDQPRAEYFVEPSAGLGSDGDVGRVTGQYELFRDSGSENPNFLPMRWFAFDSGQPVSWRIQAGGQPGFSAQATAAAFQVGIATWNNDSGSNVNYRYVGTTNTTTGFSSCPRTNGSLLCYDGLNAMIYDNADGSIGSGDFVCEGSRARGTLAIGGPWYCQPGSTIGRAPFYNQATACPAGPSAQFNGIFEAEIITNGNIECLFDLLRGQPDGAATAQRALEALFGHELGHTLGIDHPCEDEGDCNAVETQALMFPNLNTQGPGSVLNSDDQAAVRFLYRGSSTPGSVPAAPTNLIADLLGPTRVGLEWEDNSNNETSFLVQVSIAGAGFETLATVPANTTEYVASGLLEQTEYLFRVRARNGRGNSVPSNEVGIETAVHPPQAPANLLASAGSPTTALLTWTDRSDNEEEFVVEARTPLSGAWQVVKEGIVADPEVETVSTEVEGLATGVPHSFRVRARNSGGQSAPSNVDAATPVDATDGCTADDTTLCLLENRFRVTADWRVNTEDPPSVGVGRADELSDRSGTFWFFRPDNVELIVKVLDGTSINDFFWTFYGSLSDVEYWLTVVDTENGESRTYYNPQGERCGRLDTTSIPEELPIGEPPTPSALQMPATLTTASAEAGTCEPSATTLCLLADRFAVEVDWTVASQDRSGVGTAVKEEGRDRSGYFWFFNPSNIELVVKALDGRPVNGHFWIFYGALSDVEYEITVTDTVSGASRTYVNEQGNQCGQFDDKAFLPAEG